MKSESYDIDSAPRSCMPETDMRTPDGPAYVDRVPYRAVHFLGSSLCDALRGAVRYLSDLEEDLGKPPHVLALHHEFSTPDRSTELAWRVTVVLGRPDDVP